MEFGIKDYYIISESNNPQHSDVEIIVTNEVTRTD